MNRFIYLSISIVLFFADCNKDYEIISEEDLKKLVIQDTLVSQTNHLVMNVSKSISDTYPKLLVKTNRLYLFETDCELKNDSIVLAYYPAFIIDSYGEFRENGIWIYAQFYNEGIFPFNKKGIKFNVDSIPENWNKKLPTQEGIYIYENNLLKLLSKEQSEEKFKEKEKNGFYFIPNKGRLFNKININELD